MITMITTKINLHDVYNKRETFAFIKKLEKQIIKHKNNFRLNPEISPLEYSELKSFISNLSPAAKTHFKITNNKDWYQLYTDMLNQYATDFSNYIDTIN